MSRADGGKVAVTLEGTKYQEIGTRSERTIDFRPFSSENFLTNSYKYCAHDAAQIVESKSLFCGRIVWFLAFFVFWTCYFTLLWLLQRSVRSYRRVRRRCQTGEPRNRRFRSMQSSRRRMFFTHFLWLILLGTDPLASFSQSPIQSFVHRLFIRICFIDFGRFIRMKCALLVIYSTMEVRIAKWTRRRCRCRAPTILDPPSNSSSPICIEYRYFPEGSVSLFN